MDLPKLLIGTVASAATMLVLTALWHIAVLGPFYVEELPGLRQVARFDVLCLAYLCLALLMAYVYPRGYSGGPPAAEGFRFGMVMGLAASLPAGMVIYALTGGVSGTFVLVEAAWRLVEQGAGGMVIGLVCGRRVAVGDERVIPDEDALR